MICIVQRVLCRYGVCVCVCVWSRRRDVGRLLISESYGLGKETVQVMAYLINARLASCYDVIIRKLFIIASDD